MRQERDLAACHSKSGHQWPENEVKHCIGSLSAWYWQALVETQEVPSKASEVGTVERLTPCKRQVGSSRQAVQAQPEDGQIPVQEVAQGDGGEMKAWCQHQGLPESAEFNGRELSPEDTPTTIGWQLSDGVMKVDAKPRDPPEPPDA